MSAGSPQDEELTVQAIHQRYKGMWIAFIVTKRESNKQPAAGKVVASSHDRYQLRTQIAQYDDVCIMYAGENPYPLFL